MKIEIHNNTAIGSLEFNQDVKIPEEALTLIRYKLHDIEWCIWYDYEQNIVYMKIKRSIVSMMQFRKFILMNWPNALKEFK